jgi:uncharacterized cupin superfamily protein
MIVDPALSRKSETPDEHVARFGRARTLHLSDTAGLSQFGAHLQTLEPGAASSERHWHEAEDEFLYALDGMATVHDDDGMHDLSPGDAACWRHGDPNAHRVFNRTDADCRYLIVGSRAAGDVCHYPDSGSKAVNGTSRWQVTAADGSVLREGDLPEELLNLPAPWGSPFDPAHPGKRILRKGEVAPVTGPSSYPAPYTLPDGRMRWWPISDEGGLTQFGAFTEELAPGAQSSQRHWHEAEDEFLYVLDGEVTVVENDGDHVLRPGDAACWPAGAANAHCLRNRTDRPVAYLIVGTRARDDACIYPDIDLRYVRKDGVQGYYRNDGTPYPGWPKRSET